MSYLIELHNGRLFGWFGEATILIQGLALAVLPIAGITLWWRRRRH